MHNKKYLPLFAIVLAGSALLLTNIARADDDDDSSKVPEPITLLINYHIASSEVSATADGTPYYLVGGPGYVPERIFEDGVVSDKIDPERQIVTLQGAQITFTGDPSAPIVNFTCIAGSCKMIFNDGSVLESNAGVQLEGRAINMWGPVFKAPSYDPLNGIIPIRILGCGGLKEVAGKGRLAGMVGSVCFNGILNFNMFDQTQLTGSSKCTITMHTPMDPASIP